MSKKNKIRAVICENVVGEHNSRAGEKLWGKNTFQHDTTKTLVFIRGIYKCFL